MFYDPDRRRQTAHRAVGTYFNAASHHIPYHSAVRVNWNQTGNSYPCLPYPLSPYIWATLASLAASHLAHAFVPALVASDKVLALPSALAPAPAGDILAVPFTTVFASNP